MVTNHVWMTSDTNKPLTINRKTKLRPYLFHEGPKVQLLNPFGKPYVENYYNGDGVFAGKNVFALVAEWNAPDKCVDMDGDPIPEEEKCEIGLSLISKSHHNFTLKYPVKIVEHDTTYEKAGCSPFVTRSLLQSAAKGTHSLEDCCNKTIKDFTQAKIVYEEFLSFMDDFSRTNISECIKKLSEEKAKKRYYGKEYEMIKLFCEFLARDERTPKALLNKLIEDFKVIDLTNSELTHEQLNLYLNIAVNEPYGLSAKYEDVIKHSVYKPYRGENILDDIHCPFCGSDSLKFYFKDENFFAKCITCNEEYKLSLPMRKLMVLEMKPNSRKNKYVSLFAKNMFQITAFKSFDFESDFYDYWEKKLTEDDDFLIGVFVELKTAYVGGKNMNASDTYCSTYGNRRKEVLAKMKELMISKK